MAGGRSQGPAKYLSLLLQQTVCPGSTRPFPLEEEVMVINCLCVCVCQCGGGRGGVGGYLTSRAAAIPALVCC